MSDEDFQEKTEDPSERRKRESRAKGMIVRSKELPNLAALIGGVLILKSYGDKLVRDLKDVFHDSLSFSADVFKDDYYIVKYAKEVLMHVSLSVLPILLFFVVIIVAAGSLVGGLNLSWNTIGFKLERLNVFAGIKKMFSSKMLFDLIKSFIKFLLISVTASIVIMKVLPKILYLDELDVFVGIDVTIDTILWVSLMICIPLILVTLIDIPYQMWNLNKMLKMTKQELKDESKDTDGNPQIKSRIRKLQHEISKRKMMKELPTANVIITNPEHFAVALRYDENKSGAPVVVAKGMDLMAQLIKKIGGGHNIPIVEAPSVARSLYYNVEIGYEIPTGLYIAVAKILTYIHELNLYKKGKINRPKLKTDFQIPSELVR